MGKFKLDRSSLPARPGEGLSLCLDDLRACEKHPGSVLYVWMEAVENAMEKANEYEREQILEFIRELVEEIMRRQNGNQKNNPGIDRQSNH